LVRFLIGFWKKSKSDFLFSPFPCSYLDSTFPYHFRQQEGVSFPNGFPPLTSTEISHLTYLRDALDSGFTEKAHQLNLSYFDPRHGLPKHLKTLKEKALKMFAHSGFSVERVYRNLEVPYFSLPKCLKAWLLHPILSRVIVEVSDNFTLPHLDFMWEHRNCASPCRPGWNSMA